MISRHVLVIPAGAADEPLEPLDGRTPLEAALTPAMDEIVRLGRQGTVRTVPPGFAPSRDVATLTLAGYDVRRAYSGYAGLEALGLRIPIGPGEVAFRANLVTIDEGRLHDATAGRIDTDDARTLFDALNAALSPRGVCFHTGLSYRGLMVTAHDWAAGVSCTPAHDMVGERLDRHWPGGRGAGELQSLMLAAHELLRDHPVNRRRAERGAPPANGVWLWGQGVLPRVRRFRERFGKRTAALGDVPLFRGVAFLLGWRVVEAPGAIGSADADDAPTARAALAALDEADLVVVHVEEPADAAYAGDLAAKTRALERIDRHVVGPLLERLRREERWSLLVAPDIAIHAIRRAHAAQPVPFCVAGSGPFHGPIAQSSFGESAAQRSDLHVEHGWELMEYFLRT